MIIKSKPKLICRFIYKITGNFLLIVKPCVNCFDIPAWEWSGRTEPQRHTELILDEEQSSLTLLSDKGKTLRTVDFIRMQRVTIYTNNDTRRNLLMLHIPREYDLVSSQSLITVH